MVAALFVREYICKHLSAVWVCELVPYQTGALNAHPSQLERKSIRARQNNYKKPKLFCIPLGERKTPDCPACAHT
jgi:hypothetical protein